MIPGAVRRGVGLWMAVLVAAATGACTPPSTTGGTSSSGGSSGSSGSSRVGSAFRELLRSQCDLEERCAAQMGRSYVDLASCQLAADYLGSFYDSSYGEVLDRTYRVDDAQLSACQTTMATAACDNVDLSGGPCASFLVPINPAGLGEECVGVVSRPCGSGLYCDYGSNGPCTTCKAQVENGGACTTASECRSSMCANNVCTAQPPRAREGESCLTASCYGNFECVHTGATATCRRKANLGETCETNAASCLSPLRCDETTHVCRQLLANGSPCQRNPAAGENTCLGACRFATPDAEAGTCGDPLPYPGAGQACFSYGGCDENSYADQTPINGRSACECKAKKPDGAACGINECQNVCVDGTCGMPGAVGAPCRSDSSCESAVCGFTPGATGPTCQARQCMPPSVSCTPPPANSTRQAAVTLSPGTAVTGRFCGTTSDQYYWVIPGPFTQGQAVEFMVAPEAGRLDSLNFRFSMSNGTFDIGSCYAGGNSLRRCAVFPQDTGDLLVALETYQSTPSAQSFYMFYRTVGDGEGACSTQPTNVSADTATVLQSGTPTTGAFCSRGTNVEYWWHLPGSYMAGDVVRLDAQVQLSGNDSLGMELGFWDSVNSSFDTQEYCYFYSYGSTNPCYAMLDAAGTDVYVRTASNPSLRRNEAITLTMAEVAPPDPTCANPPTNRTAAAAAPLTLGMPTAGRFCNNVVDQEYWWVVNGAFNNGMTCRLTVTFDSGAAANDVDFHVQQPDTGSGYYTVAYCSAGSGTNEDCMGTLFVDSTRLYVVTNSNPRSASVDERFSMTLTCN